MITLTMLAPVLGGSTQLWAQTVIVLGTGLLLLIWPPRKSLGFIPNLLFVAAGAMALIAFLPAHWFTQPEWRSTLSNFGVQLPGTRSPQPWLTLQAVCMLWLGLAWAYYLFAFSWPAPLREKIWNTFCFVVLCLAATLAFCFAINKHVPFWPDVREFGFFPNRNQTSNVLGLGGIMIYANAFHHLGRRRKTGWMWLAGLALVCWALILNYSRAGIILFFSGILIWHGWWAIRSKEHRRQALAFAPLVMLAVLLLVVGGETLVRFGKESADLFSPADSARVLIYRDALDLLRQAPLGIGLGNFRSLFSLHRQFSLAPNEAIHPESDWLWIAVEMGCLEPLLLLALFGWWLRRCFPFEPGSWRQMRMAAMICGCAFVVHGFFDVSGHRIGAIWPALFLAGTALHPENRFEFSRFTRLIFRTFGACFIAMSLWWFASLGGRTWPTTATLNRLMAEIESATRAEDYEKVLRLASEGLNSAPLNWELYFKRGFAAAALYHPRAETLRDFAVARYLLPNWPDLYLKQGKIWLGVGEPDLAFDLWEEGIQRLPANAPQLYWQILDAVKGSSDLRDRWRKLGHLDRRCLPVLLKSVDGGEFRIELERLFSEDPQLKSLAPEELDVLFSAWYDKGDKLQLAQTLQQHPEWQRIGWRQLGRVLADYQDYRQAYETLRQFTPAPSVPQVTSGEPSSVLQSRFKVKPAVDDGLALYSAQVKEGKIDSALATLESLLRLEGSPKYLLYMEAELWAEKGEWQKAWKALERFTAPARR